MNFKRNDILEFDDEKLFVLASIMYEDVEYIYGNRLTADGEDLTDDFKIMEAFPERGTLKTVTDPELTEILAPLIDIEVQKALKEELGEEA